MKPLLFSVFFLSCFIISAFALPQNEEISSGNIFEGEPYLAINPANSENMIIAWMSYDLNTQAPLLDRIAIRVRSSFDGGKTWGNEVVMPHVVSDYHSADVSMAFHNDGTLYIEYIDYRTSPDSGVIVVSHSSDGGKSWSSPVTAFDGFDNNDKPIDRPWIVADNSGTPSDGTLYITTKPVFWDPVPNHPYMKYSTNGGNSWSKIAAVDGGDYMDNVLVQPMVSPAVASDGTFLAAYASWPGYLDPVKFTLASSKDKGATYTRTTIYIPKSGSKGDTLSKLGQHLAANPNDPQNMIFVTPDSRNGDNDIYAYVTIDAGATWSDGMRINDDPVGNGVWQDLVWANYSNDGKCVISWRDRRNGDSAGYEKGSDIYFAVSTDGGKSFGKNVRLSDQTAPFNKVLNGSGNDFHCTSILNDSICAAWGDTRNGKLGIYFAKAALSDGIANIVRVSSAETSPLSLFPNPAVNSLIVSLMTDVSEQIDLFVYNDIGVQVLHQVIPASEISHYELNISGLPSGVYTIEATVQKEVYRGNVVIKR